MPGRVSRKIKWHLQRKKSKEVCGKCSLISFWLFFIIIKVKQAVAAESFPPGLLVDDRRLLQS